EDLPPIHADRDGIVERVPEKTGGRTAMTQTVDPQLLERSIRILVVGCGGNGSAIVSGLPYLHQALLAFGHPSGLAVTLIDPDTVSETNCVRQPFCRTEIGFPKAIVLAHRINLFWGLNWQGMQATIQQLKKGSDVDFVIGCVDTRKARRAIDKWVLNSRVLYWLDLGNNASSGQFVLGQPKNSANRKTKDRLPTVAELYPEILKRDEKEDDQPSCSAAEGAVGTRYLGNRVAEPVGGQTATRFPATSGISQDYLSSLRPVFAGSGSDPALLGTSGGRASGAAANVFRDADSR